MTNSFVAFGVGVGAVLVVKKAGTYATSAIPEGADPGSPQRGDDDGT